MQTFLTILAAWLTIEALGWLFLRSSLTISFLSCVGDVLCDIDWSGGDGWDD